MQARILHLLQNVAVYYSENVDIYESLGVDMAELDRSYKSYELFATRLRSLSIPTLPIMFDNSICWRKRYRDELPSEGNEWTYYEELNYLVHDGAYPAELLEIAGITMQKRS
jgi:hypothetical protein